ILVNCASAMCAAKEANIAGVLPAAESSPPMRFAIERGWYSDTSRHAPQRATEDKNGGADPPGGPPDFRGSLEGNDAVDSAASFGGYTIWGVDPLRQYQKTH